MTFKIATWNVNSLKVRLPHVLEWLKGHQPDVLAIQETKLLDEFFPQQEIEEAGYHCVFSGQKTYNGVAILSRQPVSEIIKELPDFEDPQRRVLGVTIEGVRILNLYIPNGESVGSEKYQYKLNFLKHLDLFLKKEKPSKMVVLGDFNIAPQEIDVHDPALWEGKVLFSQKEREAFAELLGLGFVDCFRHLHPQEQVFSWWDYRLNAFKRKMGLRIDHILATPALIDRCDACEIDVLPRTAERPSDHAPVMASFNLR